MLNIFFGLSWAYDVLIVIALLTMLFLFIKFKVARIFIVTALLIGFTLLTSWSLTQLQAYYKSSGGIYGAITGIFNPNEAEVTVTDEITFDFKNMMLTSTSNQNEYEAEILSDKVIKLSTDDFYMVYVNDTPCTSVSNGQDYVVANYEYNFYNREMSVLCNDTLTFRFSFYTNSSKLFITTTGGSTAAEYWQEYFNYNTFIVKIAKADFDTTSDALTGFCRIQFKVDNNVVAQQLVRAGATVQAPEVTLTNQVVTGWTINDVIVDFETYTVNENVVAVANIANLYTVTISNYNMYNAAADVATNTIQDGNTLTLPAYTFTNDIHHTFTNYMYVNNGSNVTVNAGTTITVTQNMQIYRMYSTTYFVYWYDGQTLLRTSSVNAGAQFATKNYAPTSDSTITAWTDNNGHTVYVSQWDDSENDYFADYMRQDYTLYAIHAVSYTVNFYDGNYLLGTSTYSEGTTIPALTSMPFSYYDNSINGWAYNNTTITTFPQVAAGTTSINLYATHNSVKQAKNLAIIQFMQNHLADLDAWFAMYIDPDNIVSGDIIWVYDSVSFDFNDYNGYMAYMSVSIYIDTVEIQNDYGEPTTADGVWFKCDMNEQDYNHQEYTYSETVYDAYIDDTQYTTTQAYLALLEQSFTNGMEFYY